ncbi:MAG: hypothetical protein JWR15_2198 [Prosthecobacter sp.]|nr:hypothetical protein [Prosthecobacter sp.]
MAESKHKVLITGGLGYLGRRLAKHLRNAGWPVAQLTRHSFEASADNEAVLRFNGDWAAEGPSLLEGVGQIVHLACPDERQAATDPVGMTQSAFSFTHGLMQAATRADVRQVVLASTIHVYGKAMQGHVSEDTIPRPVHPYGIIKRLLEDQVCAACSSGKMTAAILRLSNGFGVPADPGTTRWSLIINDLCRQAVERNRLELKSDPRVLRNFITLQDVCLAIQHCLAHPAGQEGRLLNIGSRRAYSLGEMAGMVQDRCLAVLGRRVELHAPVKQESPIPPLDYDIGKMQACGIELKEDFTAEIDQTLAACARWFVPESAA